MENPPGVQPLSHPLQPSAEPQPAAEKRFRLWYVGWSCLDRRTTLPMLPWLMAEIRRRGQRQEPGGSLGSGVPAREVLLLLGSPTLRCVPAGPPSPGPGRPGSPAPAVFIFEHKAQHIARFVHNSHDLTYFAYLIKAQPDNPDSPMACHVFRATDPNQASGGSWGWRWSWSWSWCRWGW
uniref:PID domain-containing protein n=1 Tax=Anas platyrhynchos platyrhynchos TaxID=8840 RepID=A0A493SX87_ANAPP